MSYNIPSWVVILSVTCSLMSSDVELPLIIYRVVSSTCGNTGGGVCLTVVKCRRVLPLVVTATGVDTRVGGLVVVVVDDSSWGFVGEQYIVICIIDRN